MKGTERELRDQHIIDCYLQGASFKELKHKFNMSMSGVRLVLTRSGVFAPLTTSARDGRNKSMRDYKAQGHTMKEVADKFGVSEATVQTACKGIAPQPSGPAAGKARNQWSSIDFSIREEKAIQTIAKHLPTFEYIGGFTNADGYVDLKCKVCGSVLSRSLIGIRHGNGVKCHECEQERMRQKEIEKYKARVAFEEERIHARELKKVKSSRQLFMVFCAKCGKPFATDNARRRFCSKDCSKKMNNQIGSDGRLNRHNIVDRDISLQKVFANAFGVCQICGGLCDYNDYYHNDNGAFIAGENYPSIDHIIPLSSGGLHSWDNVRLAHKSCNSKLFLSGKQYAPQKFRGGCGT